MDRTFSHRIPARLETTRLVLCRLQHEDAEEIFYTYASKPECTRYVTWPTHQSIRDTRDYLTRTIRGWNQGLDFSFGIRLKSTYRLIGSCGFLNDAGKAQIGYILGPLHWGQGYATEATIALIRLLTTTPEIYRIGSFVDLDNHASTRVLIKAGMQPETVLKEWCHFPNQSNHPRDCLLFNFPLTSKSPTNFTL